MIHALNAFMGTVFEPVFVLALLAVLLMLWYRKCQRQISTAIWLMAGIFLFSLCWRVLFAIASVRYSVAAVIPASILAVWFLLECLQSGWRGKPNLRLRQWLLVLGCAGLVVGAGVKIFKSERGLYHEFLRAGQDMHKALVGAANPAVVITSSHGIRVAYYGQCLRNARGESMAYDLVSGNPSKKLKSVLDSHDILIAATRRGKEEETLRRMLAEVADPMPEVLEIDKYYGRGEPFVLLLIDNRQSRYFGFAARADAPPLPPGSVLLLEENFATASSVAVDQNEVLKQYRSLGFAFAEEQSVTVPATLVLCKHGKMEEADKARARFFVMPGTWGTGNHLFSSMTTYHLVRANGWTHQYRRYIAEFEVKGTPGAYIDIGMLQYQGKKYLGEQQRCGYFYALTDRYRFSRLELSAPVQNTDQFAISMFFHGDLEIGSIKFYGVPY